MTGGGGGGLLSKVGTAFIIVFVISLLALFTQLFYVFWRRRVFRRQSGAADHLSQHSSSGSTFSSKELLYFFCFRPHPNSVTVPRTTDDLNSNRHESEMEVIDVDLLKIHGMFGPPRFLFTIKEEEGEHLESPAEISLCESTGTDDKTIDDSNRSRVSLEERFKVAAEYPAAVLEVDDHRWSDATPFSTPCASPVYFTPSASPDHELVNDESTGRGMVSESRTVSFVSSEV